MLWRKFRQAVESVLGTPLERAEFRLLDMEERLLEKGENPDESEEFVRQKRFVGHLEKLQNRP